MLGPVPGVEPTKEKSSKPVKPAVPSSKPQELSFDPRAAYKKQQDKESQM